MLIFCFISFSMQVVIKKTQWKAFLAFSFILVEVKYPRVKWREH